MLLALFIVVAGILGAFAGSLINAVSLRLPADLDAIGPPVCPECSAVQPRRAMWPGWTNGCVSCGAKNLRVRLLTEGAAAALAMASIGIYHVTLAGIGVALYSLLLLLILRIDWQHHLIFTITIVPGIMLALALSVLHSPSALISAGIAGVGAGLVFGFFFALALLIYRKHALGAGDILLAVLIGTMTGIHAIIPALFIGMIMAAVGGLALIVFGLRSRRDYIPYGAYLCAGTIFVLLLH